MSFLQLALTTWASVVTWTLPRASACKHSGSPFWTTWVSQSWRGLRALSFSYVCQWTASWENLGRQQSSSMTLCLTVSDVDLLLTRIFYCIISHLQFLWVLAMLAGSRAPGITMSVCQSANVSGWFVWTFMAQRMNPTEFDDPLTFPLVPQSVFTCHVKYINIYWMDWPKIEQRLMPPSGWIVIFDLSSIIKISNLSNTLVVHGSWRSHQP